MKIQYIMIDLSYYILYCGSGEATFKNYIMHNCPILGFSFNFPQKNLLVSTFKLIHFHILILKIKIL